MKFKDLMQNISNSTGYEISWDPILNDHITSTAFKNTPVLESLPLLLRGLSFAVKGKKMFVIPPKDYKPPSPPGDIFQVKNPPPGGWFDY